MRNLAMLLIPAGLIACGTQVQNQEKNTGSETDAQTSDDTSNTDDSEDQSEGKDDVEVDTEEETEETEETEEETVEEIISFKKVGLFQLPGSAWIHAEDLNNDGRDEFLLTSMSEGVGDWPSFIGSGAAYILSQDSLGTGEGDIGTWSSTTVFDRVSEIEWPNDSSFFDVNNDGIKDWVIGRGFIPLPDGGITWLPGVEDSNGNISFDTPDVIETPWTDRFYHKAYPADLDGDGDTDFITTNYKNAETDWFGNETTPGEAKLEWFENTSTNGQASFVLHEISNRGGALLATHDVDGDGDTDVIVPQYFNGDSLIWMENNGNDQWTEHLINNTTGRGFDVELADMNGDGKLDIVYGNHNHQGSTDPAEQVMGIYWFEIPDASQLDELENWDAFQNTVFEGFYVDEADAKKNGAPGVFHTGDVNSDGLMDVSVSGDGDDGLYSFVQDETGSFEEILVDSGTIMGGDHHMADFDGDGRMDYIWAIYGAMDLFSGQIAPESEVNIYLQEVRTTADNIENYSGTINFELVTSFGPDTCTGVVDIDVEDNTVDGSYQCSFGIIGSQDHPITGTIDNDGNITGLIDISISFTNSTYTLDWTGNYDGTKVSAETSGSAMFDTMEADYNLSFIAQ